MFRLRVEKEAAQKEEDELAAERAADPDYQQGDEKRDLTPIFISLFLHVLVFGMSKFLFIFSAFFSCSLLCLFAFSASFVLTPPPSVSLLLTIISPPPLSLSLSLFCLPHLLLLSYYSHTCGSRPLTGGVQWELF